MHNHHGPQGVAISSPRRDDYLEVVIAFQVRTVLKIASIELQRLLAGVADLPLEHVGLQVLVGDRCHLLDDVRQLQGLDLGHLLLGQYPEERLENGHFQAYLDNNHCLLHRVAPGEVTYSCLTFSNQNRSESRMRSNCSFMMVRNNGPGRS